MKRKHRILLGILALCVWSAFWILRSPAPLDLSNDEEPFRSMVLPPKSVRGGTYMDGGSAVVLIVDQDDKSYEITFPIDYHGILNAHPDAYLGNINGGKMVPLKDPARAKAIVIRLVRDYGVFTPDPRVDPETSEAEMVLEALCNPPQQVTRRLIDRVERAF